METHGEKLPDVILARETRSLQPQEKYERDEELRALRDKDDLKRKISFQRAIDDNLPPPIVDGFFFFIRFIPGFHRISRSGRSYRTVMKNERRVSVDSPLPI